MTDEDIRARAIAFAKENKNRIAKELTNTGTYPPDATPISVFMAGSPGAGKTELSKGLIETLRRNPNIRHDVIRIDGDDIRRFFSDYTGANSYLFQGAISIIVDRMQDLALEHKQTFVFDGTLFDYKKAIKNIKRSLGRNRVVFIFYAYQDPEVAWRFTQAREKTEGRHIPKPAFISGFLGARETVSRIRKEFGKEVVIILIQRNFEKDIVETVAQVEIQQVGKQIDDYIPRLYTRDELENLL